MDSYLNFAHRLFELEDADPGYMALARVKWSTSKKLRFVAAWCTYYHPGIAAAACEYTGKKFWDYLFSVYKTAPRASERRHFRGQAGLKALRIWERQTPESLIDDMFGSTYFEVRKNLKHVPQYGDYFAWKIADVQDRVFKLKCDFTGAEMYSPKVPQEGAIMIARSHPNIALRAELTVPRVYDTIIRYLNRLGHDAPPWYDRPVNVQEAETVCCVFHQYAGGSYTYDSRNAKMTKRLLDYPTEASMDLLEALHAPHKGRKNLTTKELRRWADGILTSG